MPDPVQNALAAQPSNNLAYIGPTPRNRFMGGIADLLAMGYKLPNMPRMGVPGLDFVAANRNRLLDILGVGDVQKTAETMSYGGRLGTGAGMTYRPLPETLGAAMSVAPMVAPAARMAGEGAMATGRFVAPKAGQLAEQYMVNTGGILPLDVYHGSPHTFPPTERNPLGEFDASKIGTGEGAQAFGHGIYVAENKNIAQNYADVLASPRNRVMDKTGVYIEPSPMGDGTYRLAKQSEIGKMRGTIGDATQGLTDYQYPNLAAAIKGAKKQGYLSKDSRVQLNAIGEDGKYVPVRSASDVTEEKFGFGPEYAQFIASEPGNLYKVDLPDEKIAKMLDFDKPLSQQSKQVKQAIEKTKAMLPSNALDDLGGDLSLMYGPNVMPVEFLNTWESLGQKAGGEIALQKFGIPGIKYFDEGSRSAGQGTRNFVVFPGEEKSMTILERNGQPAQMSVADQIDNINEVLKKKRKK